MHAPVQDIGEASGRRDSILLCAIYKANTLDMTWEELTPLRHDIRVPKETACLLGGCLLGGADEVQARRLVSSITVKTVKPTVWVSSVALHPIGPKIPEPRKTA